MALRENNGIYFRIDRPSFFDILVISGKADIFIHEPLSWRGEGVMKWNIVKLLTLESGSGCAGINEILVNQ